MKTTRAIFILTIALILLLLLSACKRSLAGEQNPPAGSDATSQPDTTQTSNVENQLYIFETQTAIAVVGAPQSGTAVQLLTPIVPPQTQAAPPVVGDTPVPAVPAAPTAQPPAPTQPLILATAPPLVVPATYTLQTGEFPFCIARRFNIDPGNLLRANGLNSYSVYYAGMALRIPQGDAGFPGSRALMAHPTSYTVRGGDTIHTIACAFGDVDPNAIAVVNALTPPYRVSAGQVLQIP